MRQGFDHIYAVAVGDKRNTEFANEMTSQTLNYSDFPVGYDVIEKFAAKVCTDVANKLFESLFLYMSKRGIRFYNLLKKIFCKSSLLK